MEPEHGLDWSLPIPELLTDFRKRFDLVLHAFLGAEKTAVAMHGEDALASIDALRQFLDLGGKRIRPLLACAGFAAAGGSDFPRAMSVGVGLELLHTFALIHDDLMDRSDLRRGKPTLHRWVEARHRAEQLRGSSEHYGKAMAIVLGDLALMFADDALNRVAEGDLEKHRAIMSLYHTLKIELVNGQILDMRLAGNPTASTREDVMRVMQYKTGKYTVERPLHLGALLSGASSELLSALSAIAIPMGVAFQLQDDLLGVFGDPDIVGKPVDSDLREGKVTLLVVETFERASAEERALFLSVFGSTNANVETWAELRVMMERVGARSAVEQEIAKLLSEAQSAVNAADLPRESKQFLLHLNQFLRDRAA